MSVLVFVVKSGLYQFVDFPTRGCNLLDVILADDHFIVSSVTAGPPFGNSDHLSIKFVLNVKSSNNASDAITDSSNIQYNWYKADFESMRGYLNTVDWHNMLYHNRSALSFWRSFVDTLWSAVAMFVPLRSTSNVSYHNHKRYPKSVRRLMAKKRRVDFGKDVDVTLMTGIQDDHTVTALICVVVAYKILIIQLNLVLLSRITLVLLQVYQQAYESS